MAVTVPTNLIDLLELSFERPQAGTVNLRLLYSLIKALIVGLKIDDLVVDVETVTQADQDDQGDEGDKGATDGTQEPTSQQNPRPQGTTIPGDIGIDGTGDGGTSDGGPGEKSGSSTDSTYSAMQGSGSITLGSGSTTTETGTMTMDLYSSTEDSKQQEIPQLTEITNLLRAYLVRLQALEVDVAALKSGRTEMLEMLAKVLDQIALLESRLCEEQKKVAKLTADLECLCLIVGQYETRFEDLERGLDKLDAQIQTVKCNIRCIEKEREKFMDAVRVVTEQINYFALVKADKKEVQDELKLRAYAADLNKYVPFDCFNVIQVDAARNIALMHEEIFSQSKWIRAKIYELEKAHLTKAEQADLEAVKKDIARILLDLRRIEQKSTKSKVKPPGSAAGVSRGGSSRPSSCLACGDHADLDDCAHLVPQTKPLTPVGRAKEIFTINKRYVAGDYTKVAPGERLMKSCLSLRPSCISVHKTVEFKQIVGSDGCCYQADPDLSKD